MACTTPYNTYHACVISFKPHNLRHYYCPHLEYDDTEAQRQSLNLIKVLVKAVGFSDVNQPSLVLYFIKITLVTRLDIGGT